MPLTIAAYANCDDTAVFWKIDEPIANCLGFALERETIDAAGQKMRSFVNNRTGFAHSPGVSGEQRSSAEWPFQRFSWTDYQMDLGDNVRYRVTPMLEDSVGRLFLAVDQRSGWTPRLTLSGMAGAGVAAFFNRGLVISQFMSRYLTNLQKQHPGETWSQTLARFKGSLDQHETPIRRFLSGELRLAMLQLLGQAKAEKGHVYAALYELGDTELINALTALGDHAHVVLANGSVDKKAEDENKIARAALQSANVEVFDRMTAPSALAHNKFLVLADETKRPRAIWTGSTNWTKTGLCTQVNNGLFIESVQLAKLYFAQWQQLRDAGSTFPQSLTVANSTAKPARLRRNQIDLWFTRTQDQVDMEALNSVVLAAQKAILFLMFMPGGIGVFKVLQDRYKASPELYIHGVVSDLPKPADESAVDVTLLAPSGRRRIELDIPQPQGIKTPFASWAAEVTRGAFKANIGHAIVHSKLMVIDPFTNPVVVTGSHNFSKSASEKNDENFVIIRGNEKLAQAFAVHILSVYHHYRWRKQIADKQAAAKDPWRGLSDKPSWQFGHLRGARRREMAFWVP